MHGDWIFKCAKKTGKDADGNTLDWGFVGSPREVDGQAVLEMLNAGMLPVITPLGAGADGAVYNMNADTAASSLAMALRARKLAFISDVPGLLRDINDPESRINSLRSGDVEKLKEAGIVGGGMLPKLDSCVEAIRAGVGKVHLVDGRMPHSLLLEIFTKTGVGTEIVADE
jgi:acetylglutamate kinase